MVKSASYRTTPDIKKTNFSPLLIRYLLQLFFPTFFVALIFFILILELGDMFYNLVSFMENNVPITVMLKISALYIPKCISYAAPLSMLFAGSYTLGNLYVKKELTVIFSSGVSLKRFVLPILIFAFLCSVGMLFFEDRVVIKTLAEKNALLKTATNKTVQRDSNNVAVRSDSEHVVYTAEYYDSINMILHDVRIIHRDTGGTMDTVIIAPSANWDAENECWVVGNPVTYRIDSENHVYVTNASDFDYLTEPPESFENIIDSIDNMTAQEAKAFLKKLERAGFSQAEYLVKYYQRFSFPFTIFIVLFLSISVGGYLEKNVLLMSLLLSLSFAVLYYVSQMIMAVLASWSLILPLVGAWFPFVFFFAVSLYLMVHARS